MSDDQLFDFERARRTIAWLAYAHAYDTPEIGHYLRRDPATVRAMIARLDRLIDEDPKIADRMIGIAALVEKSILR